MKYYLSMQMVRFRSPNEYERLKMLFANIGEHLKQLDGFVYSTWWEHPDDSAWFNEISIWISKEATEEWHNNGYHQYLKKRGLSGPTIEDIVTNWTLVESNIMRLCPVCAQGVREEFEMPDEATTRATPRTQCDFKFPTLGTTASNFGVFRD